MAAKAESIRAEIYRSLEESIAKNGGRLEEEKIRVAVEQFDFGTKMPIAYPMIPGADVRLVACPITPVRQPSIPPLMQEIAAAVADSSIVHVNTEDSMHVTMFHASHPDDRRPYSSEIRAKEIAILRDIVADVAPFSLPLHSITAASSGSIIMLMDDPHDITGTLRRRARTAFPDLPSKVPQIVHSTLVRVLSPSISSTALDALQSKCRELTKQLRDADFRISLESVWYVEETHYSTAKSGPCTTIPFPASSTEA
ncbi:Aste57867_8532 [Aphanomyces stellatus]|uniref:Aste57867_8532 protein n=1 Tax=Aphanomyces stellatus TaxID=120398 RepID=A0A485KKM7_9STRA|nr:hypothetical protein As57867_008500 [Aphanomyces stellatus]VFT85418.1 Aste57867_8532 [Aphanomyces stellatus]